MLPQHRQCALSLSEAIDQKRKMAEIEKERVQESFREGLFVRALGRPRSANPYPPNTNEGLLWERGWRSVDEAGENASSVDATSRIRLVPSFTPGAAPTRARRESGMSFIANYLPSVRIIEVLRIATVIAMGILMLIALRW
jgi:hypothetical protein